MPDQARADDGLITQSVSRMPDGNPIFSQELHLWREAVRLMGENGGTTPVAFRRVGPFQSVCLDTCRVHVILTVTDGNV